MLILTDSATGFLGCYLEAMRPSWVTWRSTRTARAGDMAVA